MFPAKDVKPIAPDVLIFPANVIVVADVKLIAPETLATGAFTVNVPVPAASVIVIAPVALRPFDVPKSSLKLATVKFEFAASLIDKLPVLLLAILLNTFPALVNVALVASRRIKFPTRLIAPL
jgi:hypothetical protein